MSYIALYRKYRPLDFNDFVGQENVVKILKNQILQNKLAHAYIFSGSRGTGKTSAAKIFARAINCLDSKNGEPCNNCEACKSIINSDTTDVIEMDAASNNSVDNIRQIRQEVVYSTATLKYRVYIIDEAHMLSTSACNALLKTLEEPPENVIFILATTEEYKILPTILSRCVRFEFKKINIQQISNRLKEILKKEDIKYEDKAIEYISKLADGSLRDALSILERSIDTTESAITYDRVVTLIGNVDKDILYNLTKGIIEYDLDNVNDSLDKIFESGKNLRNIINSVLEVFIEILKMKKINKTSIEYEEYEKFKNQIDIERINDIINTLVLLDEKVSRTNTNTIFKATIMQLSLNIDKSIKELNKTKVLQKKEEIEVVPNIQETIKKPIKEAKEDVREIKKQSLKDNKNKSKRSEKLLEYVIKKDMTQIYSVLMDCNIYETDKEFLFETKNNFAHGILIKKESKEFLNTAIEDLFGEDKKILIQEISKDVKIPSSSFEDNLNNLGVDYLVVD